ncbi:Rv1815 family serine proteinase [[Mycobacterium] nativiensis]|uniref:S1 family peptidase n=1 Tax=[Mycobacterium] nativiensis TaxID=2855503 RepID=A0ABU5XRB4_9MYCO|nr:S1 family peptidase [Mycolicibacter sp. MYC340]MEB3030514.1 S1 family peptidase [Mycolicibacter sp. MYC340]
MVRAFALQVPVVAVLVAALMSPAAGTAGADPVLVYPGMEVRQDTHVCTLGYVDPVMRVAFTAGHCRGNGTVTDRAGNVIGTLATYRDNTPNGATVNTDQVIADYEAIVLADGVDSNDILPGGLRLEAGPDDGVAPGDPVCHFGIVTGQTCGTVERVNNGWFTMTNGVRSQQGDSGGPVYVIRGAGPARIVGLFNSVWGDYPAAVSWSAISQQVREDVGIPVPHP